MPQPAAIKSSAASLKLSAASAAALLIESLTYAERRALATYFTRGALGRCRRDERDAAIIQLAMRYPAALTNGSSLAVRIARDLVAVKERGPNPLDPFGTIKAAIVSLNNGEPLAADTIQQILSGTYRQGRP